MYVFHSLQIDEDSLGLKTDEMDEKGKSQPEEGESVSLKQVWRCQRITFHTLKSIIIIQSIKDYQQQKPQKRQESDRGGGVGLPQTSLKLSTNHFANIQIIWRFSQPKTINHQKDAKGNSETKEGDFCKLEQM